MPVQRGARPGGSGPPDNRTRSLYRSADLRETAEVEGLSPWTTVPAAFVASGALGLVSAAAGAFLVFAVGFAVSWLAAAIATRRTRVATIAVWTPFAYIALAIAAAVRQPGALSAADLTLNLTQRLVLDAPTLVVTELLIVVVLYARRPRR